MPQAAYLLSPRAVMAALVAAIHAVQPALMLIDMNSDRRDLSEELNA
ncbi:MAG TPA: hypothetical protein VMU56_01240 [Beijerinckiaceae bacterium]|nr:hypothetical protein [Beijerinckiaceae bacterium]